MEVGQSRSAQGKGDESQSQRDHSWKAPVWPVAWSWKSPPEFDVAGELGNLNARLKKASDDSLQNFRPPTFSLQSNDGKKVVLRPGGGIGLGCGAGLGVGVTGGIGFGAGFWNSLNFVFGFGMGCGFGVGYGYGYGLGLQWDKTEKERRSSRRRRSYA